VHLAWRGRTGPHIYPTAMFLAVLPLACEEVDPDLFLKNVSFQPIRTCRGDVGTQRNALHGDIVSAMRI
jgi:hypothetical protein